MLETNHIKLPDAVAQNEYFIIVNGLFNIYVIAQISKFPQNSRKGKMEKISYLMSHFSLQVITYPSWKYS